jgi:hypothetical protein
MQREELLAELRELRNQSPSSPDSHDEATFSICTHLQEDLTALRKLVQSKADASDVAALLASKTRSDGADGGVGLLRSDASVKRPSSARKVVNAPVEERGLEAMPSGEAVEGIYEKIGDLASRVVQIQVSCLAVNLVDKFLDRSDHRQ